MLIAAAEAVGDAAVVARAATELGIDSAAIVPAEDAELIDFGPGVRFRHPWCGRPRIARPRRTSGGRHTRRSHP
jgi:hypothetical protein